MYVTPFDMFSLSYFQIYNTVLLTISPCYTLHSYDLLIYWFILAFVVWASGVREKERKSHHQDQCQGASANVVFFEFYGFR